MDLMGVMETTMMWELDDPQEAFLDPMDGRALDSLGASMLLLSKPSTLPPSAFILVSPLPGLFFPQVSTW